MGTHNNHNTDSTHNAGCSTRTLQAPPASSRDDWQTLQRGKLHDEFQIYVNQAESLGFPVKSFDEWLEG